MLKLRYSKQFKKDFKLSQKRGLPMQKLKALLGKLANNEPLEEKYRDHPLIGTYASFRECHIEPDWLLIYKIDHDELVLIAQRTGTHSDLFGK
ncbi:MAG: type II toxin-antitoxin system YafQ family toxin [Anaerovibrio sp.]|nr:type II toxin-antitoxin system YafQ family toxin [Anaerovibrio sp.]